MTSKHLPPPLVDLNDISVFTRVVDEASFSAAARTLGVPTSTVSRRIARLEDRLGVRLLRRTTRRVSVTDAGQVYYDRCISAISDLAEADRAIRAMEDTPRGRLRVTAPHDMTGRLARLIDHYLTRYPEVQLELSVSERLVDLVGEGFDVAVRGTMRPEGAAMIARRIEETPRLLVASPAYLERRGTPLTLEELSTHDALLFEPWSMQSSWTLRKGAKFVKVPLTPRLISNALSVVVDAACSGHGIAQTLHGVVADHLAAGRLVQVLPEACIERSAAWIVYPSRRHVLPSVRAFADLALEIWGPPGDSTEA